MPNGSGVFYNGGKFHVSKLASDDIAFAGAVSSLGLSDGSGQAQGIAAAITANSGSASGLPQGSELPTTQQVVDYVLLQVGNSSSALQDELDKTQIALWGSDTEGDSLSYVSLSSVGRTALIDGGTAETYFISDPKNAVSYQGTSGNFSLLSGDSLYDAVVALRVEVKAGFDKAEDADEILATLANTHETALGLNTDGTYSAHAAPASSIFSYSDAAGMGAVALSDIDSASTAKGARDVLRSLIQQNHDNFEILVNAAAVDLNTLKELGDAYTLLDTEALDAIVTIASRIGLGGVTQAALTDGTVPNVITLGDLSDAVDGSANATKHTLGQITFASAPSLKAMVEASRDQIVTEFAVLQSEIDAIESGAGLEVDGSYVKSTSHYIALSSAASLKEADQALDAVLVGVRDLIDGYHDITSGAGASSAEQLDTAGVDFAFSSAALSGAFTVVHALNEISAELNSSSSSATALQAELDRTQAAIGFDLNGANTDGSNYSPTLAYGANYFQTTSATSLIEELDAFFADAHAALKGFELGTGLGHDGFYTANASSNYLTAATSLQDADNKLDAVLKAISDTNGMAANGSFVAYTGVILSDPSVTDMKKADEALEAELVRIATDLYQNPGVQPFGGFSVAGGSQTTFEEAIIAIDAMLGGDSLLEINSDAGVAGTVDLNGDVYFVKGGATASIGSPINIASSWDNTAKEMSISLDKDIAVESVVADKTINAGEQVSAPINAGHIFVIQEGLEAAEAINAGDVICLNMAAYSITQGTCYASVKKASNFVDMVNSGPDLTKVVGIAMDKTSINGQIDPSQTTAAGSVCAFITQGLVKGFDLSGCTSPSVGDELYLGTNGKVTNVPPSGDGNTTADYVSIHKIGMIVATGASAANNAILVDMKHIANDQ